MVCADNAFWCWRNSPTRTFGTRTCVYCVTSCCRICFNWLNQRHHSFVDEIKAKYLRACAEGWQYEAQGLRRLGSILPFSGPKISTCLFTSTNEPSRLLQIWIQRTAGNFAGKSASSIVVLMPLINWKSWTFFQGIGSTSSLGDCAKRVRMLKADMFKRKSLPFVAKHVPARKTRGYVVDVFQDRHCD